MAKRYDDEDYEDESEFKENEDDDSVDDAEFDIDDEAIIEAINSDLLQGEQKHKVLEQAVKLASHDILWYFRSEATKLKKVYRMYRKLLKMVEKE